ncbi:MAG: endonuclease Q family protein [Patescibacteria group bacterium]|nr:endonuclease Q family protein [Patescibacteria group bacterium]
MRFVADLHFHSKYSRAVSQDMVLPVVAEYAKKKGLDILTTADWTHPLWFREIRNQLEEYSDGVYKLKSQISRPKADQPLAENVQKETLFMLTTEISCIYSQGGKTRRVHNLVFSPDFETCEKVNQELIKRGCNLTSDGRPIIGLPSKYLLELLLSIDNRIILIPCHVWTPWFSLYGSMSGFDSIEECFGEYSKYVYAIETGLSSDPEMNWRIKELENRSIVSFSDSHSPAKMGREATVFQIQNSRPKADQPLAEKFKISYEDIIKAIKRESNSNLKIAYTIEFYPEEGKYHYTGHRNCKVVQSPQETKDKGVVCAVCKRPLTVGVMHRVEQLAQKVESGESKVKNDKYGVKWVKDPTGNHPPYVKLVPLIEIVGESLDLGLGSVKVKSVFDDLCLRFGSEIDILLKTDIKEIEKYGVAKIAEGIKKVRAGDISIDPGFDGEYGKVKIWEEKPKEQKNAPQLSLDF